ncbi:MAG: cbb3-type cytochrome c oxidase subunit 3 [Betaproteobacteria bacterium]|nr:MAG: cbb3-type cytochrome c oxidase subunit 3 [Betaproteobacteria bacterium]
MEIYSTLASALTVASFIIFLGIVAWAYSARRKNAFEAAANEPFSLPDDVPHQAPKGSQR